jgi:hypothetical protein
MSDEFCVGTYYSGSGNIIAEFIFHMIHISLPLTYNNTCPLCHTLHPASEGERSKHNVRSGSKLTK